MQQRRYYFDVWQDDDHYTDIDGAEFPSPDAAKAEVCGIIGELSKTAFQSGKSPHDIRVVVREGNKALFEATLRLDWRSLE